jgi:hypothetical protein
MKAPGFEPRGLKNNRSKLAELAADETFFSSLIPSLAWAAHFSQGLALPFSAILSAVSLQCWVGTHISQSLPNRTRSPSARNIGLPSR